jgi:ArsR family transcriptional regulator
VTGGDLALSQPISEIKAELFKALAHPARIRILEVLADGERSVGDIQPLVSIELSHLSQQLAVLRRAGLVTSRKDGSSVFYAVKDDLVVELLAVAKRLLINFLAETSDLLADLRGAR